MRKKDLRNPGAALLFKNITSARTERFKKIISVEMYRMH